MASYVYNCRNCQTFIEIVRGMTEEEVIPVCETCLNNMARVYTPTPIQFRGTGFYRTGG